MDEFIHGKIVPVDLADEMKKSYIEYSMSVIVSRALPDVRDGLKPVHRRILYAMYDSDLTYDRPYRKSARPVADVMGKYHPHGDVAIYDTLVRMAQDFNQRYPFIDGHGNFGSIDGDPAAAMRYTEARLCKISNEMLRDIEKDTVDFIPNYDSSQTEPKVLPSRFPNLLANGSSGIAVGMATNIPPHNLREIIDAALLLLRNPEASIEDLMKHIKGPDFPTAGIIMGMQGIRSAYTTGRGIVVMRARSRFERMQNGKTRIIVNELPYQVNKAKLVEKIAFLARDRKIDGITDLRDESDRDGMRIVIELRRDAKPAVILNQLYAHTQLQESFGIIMLALVNDEPRTLNLKEVLENYIEHQKVVVTRRTEFELRKARERAHILEGLRIAASNIDKVIRIIRSSKDDTEAKPRLMETFGFSDRQATAVLDMRLRRLTNLEIDKLEAEYKEVMAEISRLLEILADIEKLKQVIENEMRGIREEFGDDRRTEIVPDQGELNIEDLIAEEEVVVTLTHQGYIKRLPSTTYRSQRRGGKGVTAMGTKDEDFVENLFITTTHHYLLFFTNKGKVFQSKVYEIPEASRQAKGTNIINLLNIENEEKITAVVAVKDFEEDKFLIFSTRMGTVKKTGLDQYLNIRKGGIQAIKLNDEDDLIGVRFTDDKDDIVLATKEGSAIRFNATDVRPMGRATTGVRGITLSEDDEVIAMEVANDDADLLVITTNGFGKRTPIREYRCQSRGGKGVYLMRRTEKSGPIAGVRMVREGDDVMVITINGIIIRTSVSGISQMSRTTQGVTIMKMDEEDQVIGLAKVVGAKEESDLE
ncbi:DNA gyrase subunit A [bioreactor metagenome]|uniref:DNA topoisomerase (ATP-hydrolyzing) n=1 Tax=bioreactor metagenome TaxID=1076179 RepID=A0A644X5B1_9ZZZZ